MPNVMVALPNMADIQSAAAEIRRGKEEEEEEEEEERTNHSMKI